MSEMVERVARAMYASFRGLPQAVYSWEELAFNENDPLVLNYRRMARAAILAMREPTEAMLIAGHGANLCDNAPEVWAAMVDEGLK